MASRESRLKYFTAAGIGGGLLPTGQRVLLRPGERPYFLSVLGDAAAANSILFDNALITIPIGSVFSIGGDAFPSACENYEESREVVFNATLGPVVFIWGPVDYVHTRPS